MRTKLPEDQQAFWEDLMAHMRWVLTLVKNPGEVETYLDVWGDTPESRRSLSLGQRGLVLLKEDGTVKKEYIDKLRPSDAPAVRMLWEDTQANWREHLDDGTYSLIPGTDEISDLVFRWRALKGRWAAR